MALSKETLEREIKGSEEALKAHQEGIYIHEIVSKAFKQELEKLKKK